MNINKALEIAIKAHSQQVDKAGEAYILHPLRVMHQFVDKDWLCLHKRLTEPLLLICIFSNCCICWCVRKRHPTRPLIGKKIV